MTQVSYHSDGLIKCVRCEAEKPRSDYYDQPANRSGHQSYCKECSKVARKKNYSENIDYYQEYDRNRENRVERAQLQNIKDKERYALEESFRDVVKDKVGKHRDKYPDRSKARRKLTKAIETSKIIKPTSCGHCGTSEKKIQGHHWSYLPEHWLDVIWLCTSCHGKEHKRLNELGRDPDKLIEMENVA